MVVREFLCNIGSPEVQSIAIVHSYAVAAYHYGGR
jgi:hypothetical protein